MRMTDIKTMIFNFTGYSAIIYGAWVIFFFIVGSLWLTARGIFRILGIIG